SGSACLATMLYRASAKSLADALAAAFSPCACHGRFWPLSSRRFSSRALPRSAFFSDATRLFLCRLGLLGDGCRLVHELTHVLPVLFQHLRRRLGLLFDRPSIRQGRQAAGPGPPDEGGFVRAEQVGAV